MKSLYKILMGLLFTGSMISPVFAMERVGKILGHVAPVKDQETDKKQKSLQVIYKPVSYGKNHGILAFQPSSQANQIQIGCVYYVLKNKYNRPEIDFLYVDHNCRGHGIAPELLKRAFVDIAEKSESLESEVDLRALPCGDRPMTLSQLLAFYQRQGGRVVSKRRTDADLKFLIQKSQNQRSGVVAAVGHSNITTTGNAMAQLPFSEKPTFSPMALIR